MAVKMWKFSYLFLQLLLMLTSIHGASWREARQEEVRPGKCPHYDSQKNFTPQKFAGTWFVANQYQTYEHRRFLECQQLDLTAVPGNDLSFDIKGYVRASPNLGIQTLGEAIIPDANSPSVMRWSWDYFPNIIDFVSVLDTDYDNYAVIILCQDFGLLHTVYPFLMTREKPMDVTDTYTKYYELAKTLFPFPVYTGTGWRDIPDTCSLDFYFKDEIVKKLDIDDIMRSFSNFFKAIT